jgi:hypothetical protein
MKSRACGFWLLAAPFLFTGLPGFSAAEEPKDQPRRIVLSVSETAGIRRFGYPVTAVLPLPEPVKDTDHFRLLDGDKPVAAQFCPHSDTTKGIRAVSLDFNASPGPLERREYVVEYGPIVSVSKAKGGLRVETTEKEFRIIHPGGLQFHVSREVPGLINQVRTEKTNFLKADYAGLVVSAIGFTPIGKNKDGKLTAKVIKEGPLAVALRFERFKNFGPAGEVASVVDMEFPISKSWVRIDWMMDDKPGIVTSLGAEWKLHVEGEPILFDFGAGSSVYGQLQKGESARLRQKGESARLRQNPVARAASVPRWETFLGPAEALKPYVVSPGSATPPDRDAEGWAHVMDRERCTAVAVANFAASKVGAEITVDADGRLRIWRQFAQPNGDVPRGAKRLTFWLHFVGMPVHVGAATSPQAMLAPLHVETAQKGKHENTKERKDEK